MSSATTNLTRGAAHDDALHLQGAARQPVASLLTRTPLGAASVTDSERAYAIRSLQEIARENERLERAWDDVVIAVMELDFIGDGE